jgi:aspartate/methionine/tyrosine aminotransferase
MMELMVNPPKSDGPSYSLFQKEQSEILESLKRRSIKLAEAFNTLQGVSCNSAQGAMYLFPQVTLPPKAIAAAKAKKQDPDAFYSMALLNATGVCVVPGSGFGQVEGTYHFRSTFLPPEKVSFSSNPQEMDSFIKNIKIFHEDFMKTYS